MTQERRGREQQGKEPEIVPPPPGSIADTFREVLPQMELVAAQGVLDVVLTVRREDLPTVMQAAKEEPGLAFDYLRCVCAVDQQEDGLEVVYNLYSFQHSHTVTVKTVLPAADPKVASVTYLWNAADWLERETAEMFGITFQGHPDLRPILLEEGLGYYPLLKSHPLAEIEEWQEDLLKAEEAPVLAEGEKAEAPPMDEKAAKVALAQKKAEVMRKTREEAKAKGLSPEDTKKAVQEALKALEAEGKESKE